MSTMTSQGNGLLYLDPWAGVSGDMVLAALLDTGGPGLAAQDTLREVVEGLGLEGVEVRVERALEGGISCLRVRVEQGKETRPARNLPLIESRLQDSGLSQDVVRRSRRALRRLAEVEARLHGVSVEKVHFHELGAVDTLVDVVGAFALVEALGVREAAHGPVPLGSGWVDCEHGRLGVPAPATLELLRGRPVHGGPEEMEVTTPTGALLLTELAASAGPMPAMVVDRVGYGAGRRSLVQGPNLLRAVLGHRVAGAGRALEVSEVLIQTVIDDCTPEILAFVGERLLAEGALDVWWTPVHMKKNRAGVELSLLAPAVDEERLLNVVFAESGTFGVRRSRVERRMLDREWVSVEVEGRRVPVKVGRWRGGVVTVAAEYDPSAEVASASGVPLAVIMREAAHAARARLGL